MTNITADQIITITKVVAFIIFMISCITIYHNTNSYEPSKRIIYIIAGTIVMYGITSIIFGIDTKGIEIQNQNVLNDTLKLMNAMKLIFTPINSMILLASLGNIFGKVKDRVYGTDKAGKRVIIVFVVFIILLVFEKGYMGNFVQGLVR